MINSIKTNQPNFTALPCASYKVPVKGGSLKSLVMYELEPRDKKALDRYITNIEKHFSDNSDPDAEARNGIMKDTFKTASALLDAIGNKTKKCYNKTKIFLATVDGKACGIVIGNEPKFQNKNVVYSSRKNHAKKGTELDWLVSWQPDNSTKIKGIGQTLVTELFNSFKQSGFRSMFVRSEVPEKSHAFEFYQKMGFEQIGKRCSCVRHANNPELTKVAGLSSEEGDIIPMKISKSDIKKSFEHFSKELSRQELGGRSVELNI